MTTGAELVVRGKQRSARLPIVTRMGLSASPTVDSADPSALSCAKQRLSNGRFSVPAVSHGWRDERVPGCCRLHDATAAANDGVVPVLIESGGDRS